MIKNIIIDFFNFIKRPNDIQLEINIKEKIKFVSVLLLFEVVFTFLFVYPLFELIELIEKIKIPKIDYSETLLFTFFLGVLLVPFTEELVFRYILRYKGFKINYINILTWNKIFPYLVYLFSIVFGLIHLSNYDNQSSLFFLLSPIFILSQLIGGFVIVFIRVRINFIWGVFYHCVWNFIFIILFPIVEYQFSKPYLEITEDYKISITERPFFNKNEIQILKIDSINNKIKKIEIKQYSLQHLLDTIYKKDKYYVDDVLIDLDFINNEYKTKEEFKEILLKKYEIIE
ncbi:CPBP family intramembrane glutamic endopeptidase [Flavobacterium sp.]|jgi:membrane protease YdiL (CAAX protease family)|uniref:CPBP family intramembrane glutamic endopeptidase n=1 Tax=Flavobacterium sp. TaxID=239 RepID=UPI0037BEBA31